MLWDEKNLTERFLNFPSYSSLTLSDILNRKSKQAHIEGRQYERFLSAVGLAIDFSDRECSLHSY